MAKVPYKDTVQAINDLAEGRIHAFVGAYAIMRPRVQAGKVKVIALTNRQHAKALDDIPTATEAGFRSLEFDGLVGVLGPREVSQPVRDRIAADVREVVSDPEVESKLSATGQVVNPGTPAEFAAALEDRLQTVRRIPRSDYAGPSISRTIAVARRTYGMAKNARTAATGQPVMKALSQRATKSARKPILVLSLIHI